MSDHEWLYRWSAALALTLALAVRVLHARRHRQVARGPAVAALRERWLFALCLGGFLSVYAYAAGLLDAGALALPRGLRLGGGALLLAALWLLAATHAALGRHWSPVLELAEDHRLIDSGPYARVRHPMYASFMLAALGFALLSANLVVAAASLGGIGVLYALRVADEEAMLLRALGEPYAAYMRRTGRLWPRLRARPR